MGVSVAYERGEEGWKGSGGGGPAAEAKGGWKRRRRRGEGEGKYRRNWERNKEIGGKEGDIAKMKRGKGSKDREDETYS